MFSFLPAPGRRITYNNSPSVYRKHVIDVRLGINFPCYAFENQAETEGFAKMAKRAGYQVVGLPNYVVWHIDTDEKPGNLGDRPAY